MTDDLDVNSQTARTVPTVTLTDDALYGVHADGPAYAKAVANLPIQVKLGRVRSKTLRTPLFLGDFVDLRAADPPPVKDWYTKAAPSLARMYLNDQYGDCVVAGKAHAFGVWSANDEDSGGTVVGTDQEILSQYRKWCGHLGNDSGCIIDEVLTRVLNEGMVLGGKTYRIDGFAKVDNTNRKLVQVALLLTGAATIGIDLPSAWTNSAVWDVTSSKIVGGHDVTPCGYDETGVYVSSWGRIYRMTWPAFLSTRWVGELWVMLSPTWYGPDKRSPAGLDVEGLKRAMDLFRSGGVPDWEPTVPPPGPPPPVVPPVPPSPPSPPSPPPPVPPVPPMHETLKVTLRGDFPAGAFGGTRPVTITGTAAPASAAWDQAGDGLSAGAVDWFAVVQDVMAVVAAAAAAKQTGDWNPVVAAVKKLLADLGVTFPAFAPGRSGPAGGPVGKLTPEQWQALIQMALTLLQLFARK